MATTKKPATTKKTAAKAPVKKAVTKTSTAAKAPAKKTVPKAAAKKTAATAAPKKTTAAKSTAAPEPAPEHLGIPAPRGTTKDGIAYTKDFDVKFLKTQHDQLLKERDTLLGQASRLEDEANSLIEDGEMGDVQFDDESGEGDTMVVERERDLALSAQARQTIADIDAALVRMSAGTYGYSVVSGRPIPRERLEAIPWATVLVEEKVGGIGRR
jgi:RNA polymerase-binding transcription factor DksA